MLLPSDRVPATKTTLDSARVHRLVTGITSFREAFERILSDPVSSGAAPVEEEVGDVATDEAAVPLDSTRGAATAELLQAMISPVVVPVLPQRQGSHDSDGDRMLDNHGAVEMTLPDGSTLPPEAVGNAAASQADHPGSWEMIPKADPGRIQGTITSAPSQHVPGPELKEVESNKSEHNQFNLIDVGAVPASRAERPEPSESPELQVTPANTTPHVLQPLGQVFAQIERLLQGNQVSSIPKPSPLAFENEVRSLRLMLKPEHLGEVEVLIRRTGREMIVRILVANEMTAKSLDRDMGSLRDTIDRLMQSEGSPVVTVTMQTPDKGQQPFLPHSSGGDTTLTASAGHLPNGSGERQAPRKRDAGSRQTNNDLPDRDPLLQPRSAHIIV